MKTKELNKYLLLFDAECPVCAWAAGTTAANNILGENGKTPYQDFQSTACPVIDRQRAANEVALLDVETGQVSYGVESMFKLLGSIAPFLNPLLSFGPFVWLMRKPYKLFALNRRVIVPSAVSKNQIQPALHLGYRVAYLLITTLFAAFILTHYVQLTAGMVPVGNAYREYLICGGQIVFQGAIISLIAKNKVWDYLGNMMTISFGGALLLMPVLILAKVFGYHPVIYTAYFMAVAGVMLFEHIRRSKLLGLGYSLTASWVLYRTAILLFILY